MSAGHISRQGRASQGVRVMELRDGDSVASVAVIREARTIAVESNGEPAGDEAIELIEAIPPSTNGAG
jgi:hypothetical protein